MRSLWLVPAFLLLASCGPTTPRQAAEGYLGALGRLDFGAAAGYVSDGGKANFDELRQLYDGLSPAEKKKFQVTGWAITDEAVAGDTATVDFTFDQTDRGQLSLHRVGDVWKVDQRKTF
jgi:hypothetical protein